MCVNKGLASDTSRSKSRDRGKDEGETETEGDRETEVETGTRVKSEASIASLFSGRRLPFCCRGQAFERGRASKQNEALARVGVSRKGGSLTVGGIPRFSRFSSCQCTSIDRASTWVQTSSGKRLYISSLR